MPLLDNLLPLAQNVTGVGTQNGAWLDLETGTYNQQINSTATSTLTPQNPSWHIPLAAYIQVAGSTGTNPAAAFTLYQADSSTGTNSTVVGTVSASTVSPATNADGQYKIPLVGIVKRFISLGSVVPTNMTAPYTSYVGI